YADFDAEGNNEKVKPVGGTILSYQSKTMVFLEKGDIPGQRIATLKRHRNKIEGLKAKFRITNDGLASINEFIGSTSASANNNNNNINNNSSNNSNNLNNHNNNRDNNSRNNNTNANTNANNNTDNSNANNTNNTNNTNNY
ncbi:MAG: hypothetical protein ACRC1M_00160, partial [Methanobacteriaceae archaeon]